MLELHEGIIRICDYLTIAQQYELLDDIRAVVKCAPLYRPSMPRSGKPLSVRMSNCGNLGWVSDKDGGYRYQRHHPVSGEKWPPIPEALLSLWSELTSFPVKPEACLINYYDENARMGLHQDTDEENLEAPIMSISLGDSCLFRVGGVNRSDKTTSFKLHSGDIVILSGKSRLAYHGVDRIYAGTSTLLKNGGRVNLTLRRVTLSQF